MSTPLRNVVEVNDNKAPTVTVIGSQLGHVFLILNKAIHKRGLKRRRPSHVTSDRGRVEILEVHG